MLDAHHFVCKFKKLLLCKRRCIIRMVVNNAGIDGGEFNFLTLRTL